MEQMSGSFHVKPQELEKAAIDLDGMNQKIESLNEDVLSVREQVMSYGILNRDSILDISKSLQSELTKSRELTAGLHEIKGLYEACEQKCTDNALTASGDETGMSAAMGTAAAGLASPVMISGKIGNGESSGSGTKIVRIQGKDKCIIETDADGNVTVHRLSDEEERIFDEYRRKGLTDEEIWNVLKQHMGPDGTISCAAAIAALKEVNKAKIMKEMTDLREEMKSIKRRVIKYKDPTKKPEKVPSNYKDKCGDLVVDQLRQKGLIKKDNVNYEELDYCKGKALAENISKSKSNHVDGVEYKKYSTFEEMRENNPEPITDIVCSWDGTGSYDDDYGHTVLITRIEDGYVYLIDNQSDMSTADSNIPICMTEKEFERRYLKGHHLTGCTVCKRNATGE